MRILLTFNVCLSLIAISFFKASLGTDPEPTSTSNNTRFAEFFAKHCIECHQGEDSAAGLDLSRLSSLLDTPSEFSIWGKIHDIVATGSMPPEVKHLNARERADLVQLLHGSLDQADYQDVVQYGRGPIRRLNRSEYWQNLRDLLHLPHLDIKDLLPEDRESVHFNKSAETLDMTRVQLTAYLDASASALRQATAASTQPRSRKHFRALATNMFPKAVDHAGRESSFFAKNSRMIPLTDSELARIRRQGTNDPEMEVAIFRSASWPYYGYGAWIMDRLLGDPPPDKVPAIAPDIRGATTIREQIMKHAHATECAGCHAKFDPVGFALENFDIMGGYRERYRSLEKGDEVTGIDRAGHTYSYRIGQAVDAHGQLLDGSSFNDVRELKQLLRANPRKLAANLLSQWVIYATGTPPRFSDRREINEILDKSTQLAIEYEIFYMN